MPVSFAFNEWREAEHAALHAQAAVHGARLDHWIGGAPAPDPLSVDRVRMLCLHAHERFIELMSVMQATALALRPAAPGWPRTRGRRGRPDEPTFLP
jgi:hypothetical protein